VSTPERLWSEPEHTKADRGAGGLVRRGTTREKGGRPNQQGGHELQDLMSRIKLTLEKKTEKREIHLIHDKLERTRNTLSGNYCPPGRRTSERGNKGGKEGGKSVRNYSGRGHAS